MYTITIDCGASFVKGALFSEGTIVSEFQQATPHKKNETDIYDTTWIESLIMVVEKMISKLSKGINEAILCISNEMHGFLLTNEDGVPYTDYISWQKILGDAEELKEKIEFNDILHTGMQLRNGLAVVNIYHLVKQRKPESRNMHFYTLGDYVIRMISGCESACHPTNAAATGFYDLTTGAWNKPLLNIMDLEDLQLPTVGTTPLVCDYNGLSLKILPAIGDQQAALLGAGLSEETDLSFNLGTGAQVSKLVRKCQFSTVYQCRPFFCGYYLQTIPHIPSGRALNVYFRFMKSVVEGFGFQLKDQDIWEVIKRTSENGSSRGLEIDMSFFENPVNDNLTGSISGIKEDNFLFCELVASIVEQLGYNCLLMAKRIFPDSRVVKRVIFSGGVARRFEAARNIILSEYPEAEVVVSENDTMQGLLRYAFSMN